MFYVTIEDDDGVRCASVQARVDGEICTLALFVCLPGADADAFLARLADLARGGCFDLGGNGATGAA
jgi:hypothetical protein